MEQICPFPRIVPQKGTNVHLIKIAQNIFSVNGKILLSEKPDCCIRFPPLSYARGALDVTGVREGAEGDGTL